MSTIERDISPDDAVERFIRRHKGQHSEKTIRSYSNRLQHFLDWCDEEEIDSMREIDGWRIDEFYHWRSGHDIKPVTVKGTMAALRQLLKFCVDIGVVDETIPDRIPTINLSKSDERSDLRLEPERAKQLLAFYRDSTEWYGRAEHVTLELLWHTGCRVGGMRALDLGDFDPERRTLFFRHRPETDTRLKNAEEGERVVGINPATVDALDFWARRDRQDVADDYGREPLFTTRQGRASIATLRGWAYLGTQPCLFRECPHGRRRGHCEFTERRHASKCPSSRSPHAVRTGSITWQLGEIDDIAVVADRVNSAPSTIRRYYDVATPEEKFEERRRGIGESLDILGDAINE